MEDRYHDLVEEISQRVADRLFEDAEGLKEEHALELDAVMFQLMMHIGLAALEKLANRLVSRQVEQCRREGMHIQKSGKPIEPHTKLGTIRVESPYLKNPHTGQTTRPAKDEFGLVGRGKTPALERALADFGSESSYGDAEKRFEEHYGFDIGRTSILRVTNAVGEDAEKYLDQRLKAAEAEVDPEAEGVAEVMIQMDGCHVRTGEVMSAMRAGRAARDGYEADDTVRVEQWREVRVGLVRVRGEIDKKYVARIDDYDEICERLHALARSKGLGEETQVISPGDGGNGLKEAVEEEFPDVQFILDLPHLKEHFWETAEAMGVGEAVREQWVEQFIDPIREGEIEQVLEQLRGLHEQTDHDRLEQLIEYLERFDNCVDYDAYEEAGWPTGSGEVESAHRYIPQARLKLPGACWNVESINPMLAIRVIKKNGWWDHFWDWRVNKQKEAA